MVYAKRPFSGPDAVLVYLSRCTHRIAISNSRLTACDEHNVTFKSKDYRAKSSQRNKTMRLDIDDYIRRFLIRVLTSGYHRIRHCGFFANHLRANSLEQIREFLGIADHADDKSEAEASPTYVSSVRCSYDHHRDPRSQSGTVRTARISSEQTECSKPGYATHRRRLDGWPLWSALLASDDKL